MRSIKTMAVLAACLALAQFLVACGSSGIRNLSEVETKYFRDLNTKLKESDGKMKGLLEGPTAVNEETALRQIALLDGNIRRAKLVYSVREVLTAPKGDSAAFIQITRNKIILYYLAEAGQAENKKLLAELAKGKEERNQLIIGLNDLNKLTSEAIASNQLLHNHLNTSGTTQFFDTLAETGRQITAFNNKIKEADQDNPAVKRMMETSKAAETRIQQAEEGLSKFIEVWPMLNKVGK